MDDIRKPQSNIPPSSTQQGQRSNTSSSSKVDLAKILGSMEQQRQEQLRQEQASRPTSPLISSFLVPTTPVPQKAPTPPVSQPTGQRPQQFQSQNPSPLPQRPNTSDIRPISNQPPRPVSNPAQTAPAGRVMSPQSQPASPSVMPSRPSFQTGATQQPPRAPVQNQVGGTLPPPKAIKIPQASPQFTPQRPAVTTASIPSAKPTLPEPTKPLVLQRPAPQMPPPALQRPPVVSANVPKPTGSATMAGPTPVMRTVQSGAITSPMPASSLPPLVPKPPAASPLPPPPRPPAPSPLKPASISVSPAPTSVSPQKPPLAERLPMSSASPKPAVQAPESGPASLGDMERVRNYVDARLEDEGFWGKNPGTSQVAWKLIENMPAIAIISGDMPSEEISRELHVNHRLHMEAYTMVRDIAKKMQWTPREGQTAVQFLASAAGKGPLF